MTDITVTAANVRSYGDIARGIAGGTVTRGLTVRKNTSGQIVAASDDSAVNAAVCGIALNDAGANQPVDYHVGGNINPGGTVAVGKVYVGSTSGGIAPVDDIAGTEFITIIGVGISTSLIKTGYLQSGVAAAAGVS